MELRREERELERVFLDNGMVSICVSVSDDGSFNASRESDTKFEQVVVDIAYHAWRTGHCFYHFQRFGNCRVQER